MLCLPLLTAALRAELAAEAPRGDAMEQRA